MSVSQTSLPSDLSPEDLQQRIQKGDSLILMNILCPESHAEIHLPGSVGFCVYESAFIEKVSAAYPDRATGFVVYGWEDPSLEAREAQEKLITAGYLHTRKLSGGLKAWQASGGPVEGSGAPPPAPPADGNFAIDTTASMILWTGQNLFNFHHGRLRLSGGELVVDHGQVVSGHVIIDMRSIENLDLADTALNRALIAHLRSEDFFAVERFPTAEFLFERVEPLPDATPGLPNYRVIGSLSLRGITAPVEFLAVIGAGSDGGQTAQAQIDIDRTRWGVLYGSGRFFARLGQHLVNDLVHLHLKIVTKPGS